MKILLVEADDYLAKPFHLSELNARLNTVRRQFDGNPEIVFGKIKILPEAKEVRGNDSQVTLTCKEYDLLTYLLLDIGRIQRPRRQFKDSATRKHFFGNNLPPLDRRVAFDAASHRGQVLARS